MMDLLVKLTDLNSHIFNLFEMQKKVILTKQIKSHFGSPKHLHINRN